MCACKTRTQIFFVSWSFCPNNGATWFVFAIEATSQTKEIYSEALQGEQKESGKEEGVQTKVVGKGKGKQPDGASEQGVAKDVKVRTRA